MSSTAMVAALVASLCGAAPRYRICAALTAAPAAVVTPAPPQSNERPVAEETSVESVATRDTQSSTTANLVAFRGLWLFFTRQYSLRGGGTILWELGSVHNFTASIHRNEG